MKSNLLINWDEFKDKLALAYRYASDQRHLMLLYLLDSLYERWERGERSLALYLGLQDLELDFLYENTWSSVTNYV
jgi:hypothetical protein